MDYVNKLIVRVRESQKGQTMTEYVLINVAAFRSLTGTRVS